MSDYQLSGIRSGEEGPVPGSVLGWYSGAIILSFNLILG
jgi:hypothetical protein